MAYKITLYSDEELIKRVKEYAKSRNTSVSKIVNSFFKDLLKNQEDSKGTVTSQLAGKLKNSKLSVDDYHNYLEKKYL